MAGTAGPASAQVALPSAPTREELVPPSLGTQPRTGATFRVDGGLERMPCALDNPEFATVRVTLTGVDIAGAQAAAGVDLSSAYTPYLGREMPISVLCDIRARATALLTEAGYLAAVEIPEQRIQGGRAQLRVVLGRLIALRVRGDAGPSERLLARYLQHLVGQPVFNVKEVERYILLADDIAGLDVRLSLRSAAGGQPGDLIGDVAVLRRKAVVDASIQNYGSRALGRFGGLLRTEIYDITGAGDRTGVALYASHDLDEQQTVQLSHDFLVGSEGLSLGGQLTLGWTNPGLGLAGFTVKSDTLYAGLRASYPFIRSQARNLSGSAGLDLVDQQVRANGTILSQDNVRAAWARLDYAATDAASIARQGGYTPFEPRTRLALGVELRQGLGWLGASPDCRPAPAVCLASGTAPSRIQQDPTPFLLRAELSAEYRPVPAFALAMDLRAQLTRDPLPAFEEMSGGNYTIGRGYDPAAITGDTGIAARFELRHGSLAPRSENGLAVQPFVFLDAASLRNRDPGLRAANPDSLASLGGGVRFAHGKGIQGDVTLAVPLRRTDAQRLANSSRGDVRLLMSLTGRLAPWRF